MLTSVTAAQAAPYVPADDSVVLEQLPTDTRGEALRAAARSATDTRDPTVAVILARRYIEQSRAQADPRLLGYAQGLLQPWWTDDAAPVDVLLLRATIRQARHQFDPALRDLGAVLAQRPQDAQAWLTRATVLRVQGHYTEALTACARLRGIASSFVSELCTLGIDGLSGHLTDSITAMQTLEAQLAAQDAAVQSWFDAELADMLERAGRRPEAEARYRVALQRAPQEPGLLAAYADFLLDDQRNDDVVSLTAPFRRVDALCLRYAVAKQRLGQSAADENALLALGFEAAHRRSEDLHLREEARYELDVRRNPDRALELALRNWQVQHEPWDARILLAAALAAQQPQRAQIVRDWRQTAGLEDARLDAPLTDRAAR